MALDTQLTADLAADMTGGGAELQNAPGTSSQTTAPATPPAATEIPEGETAPAEPKPGDQTTEVQEDDFDLDTLDADKAREPEPEAAPPAEGETKEGEPPADPDQEIGALLATTRGKRIYAAFKKEQELRKPETEGGIGHAPSAEEIKQYHDTFVGNRRMHMDFGSGEPGRAAAWVQHWFGKSQDGRPKPGAMEIAEQLPAVLMQSNPQALNAIANQIPEILASNPQIFRAHAAPFQQMAIAELRGRATSAQSDEDKARWTDAADLLHFHLTGQWPEGTAQQTAQPQPNAELEQLRQRLRDMEQSQRESQRQHQITTAQTTEREIREQMDQQMRGHVDYALQQAKSAMKPTMYKAMRDSLMNDLRESVKTNQNTWGFLDQQIRDAARSANRQAIPGILSAYKNLYRDPLVAKRKEYIEAAGLRVMSDANARAAQLQQASEKVGANGGVQKPTPKPVVAGSADRQPGESEREYMTRLFQMDMSAR